MSELQTSPGGAQIVDWRSLGRDVTFGEKPADMLEQHGSYHAAGQQSYGVYLAIAILIFVVVAVYGLGQLMSSMGDLGSALGR